MLLHAIGEAECIIEFAALEYVQPSAENNFPAMVSRDVAVAFGACGVKGPGKLGTDPGAGSRDLLKILGLKLSESPGYGSSRFLAPAVRVFPDLDSPRRKPSYAPAE